MTAPIERAQPRIYRRVPDTVEALQVTDFNGHEIADLCGWRALPYSNNTNIWSLETSDGTIAIGPGDWIVRESGGFRAYGDPAFQRYFRPVLVEEAA